MIKKVMIIWFCLAACQQKTDIEKKKLAAYQGMEEKVQAVILELNKECDSTIMQMARHRADSILLRKNGQSKKEIEKRNRMNK